MVLPKSCSVVRSSSQGEIGVFHRVIPINSVDDFSEKKRPAFPNRVSKSPKASVVFTIGSPERDEEDLRKIENGKKKHAGEGFLEFLQKCFLCKKALKGEVYMYGYLGAFCSIDCREDRMALDGFHEQMDKEAKETAEKFADSNKIKNWGLASRFK